MPASKGDAQGIGSALTYARRYGLSAITGVAPEDDDGDAASGAPKQSHGPIKAPPATAAQQAAQLPEQLAASVDILGRAKKVSDLIASRRTVGELQELWLEFDSDPAPKLWPEKVLQGLKLEKNARYRELKNVHGIAK